jgi:hypothetical protein
MVKFRNFSALPLETKRIMIPGIEDSEVMFHLVPEHAKGRKEGDLRILAFPVKYVSVESQNTSLNILKM